MKKQVILLATLVVLSIFFFGCAAAPVPPPPACDYPVAKEKAGWQAQGLTVRELNAKALVGLIKMHFGEEVIADQAFLLSKPGAANVILVFAEKGCAKNVMVLSVDDFNALVAAKAA